MNAPKATCRPPAISTASRNASNEPSEVICASTTAASPAAGPLTLTWEPLRMPTTMPPMTPEIRPERSGAPEASAIPRQSGSATRNTTRPATMSRAKSLPEGWAGRAAVFMGGFSSKSRLDGERT